MSERFQHKDNEDCQEHSFRLAQSSPPSNLLSTLLYTSLSSLDMVEIESDGSSIAIFLQQDEEFRSLIDSWLESEISDNSSPKSLSSEDTPSPSSQTDPTSYHQNDLKLSADHSKKRGSRVTRRPSPNISFLPGFRILKRDIRRKYAEMFNNVFNSHDPMMIFRFLQTFAAPDCRLADTISADISSRTVFQSTFVIGVAGIMKLLAVHSYMIPDMVVLLHEAKVCKRSDQRGSRVMAHVTLRGTHLFIPDVPIGQVEVDEQGAIQSKQFQLQSRPKAVCIEGVFVFHLDELHRMRVLELSCDKYSESSHET